jgi:hypothetical protein
MGGQGSLKESRMHKVNYIWRYPEKNTRNQEFTVSDSSYNENGQGRGLRSTRFILEK